ncbi:MAG: TolC family protein [candidate division KSB1 bacterium]|nr:TolC family protein [candidate division KSB1 bacterium]MDZ7302182.1 TolC family protein [candidate division KSB1 bacterium]MDZ7311291.1 TolC family protein [candidate division KSB1 bacterium]
MFLYLRSCMAVLFAFLFLINKSGAQEKLSLHQAVELALRQNPQLAIAQQEIAAAQGQSVLAGALPPAEIFSRVNEINFDFSEQDEIEIGLSQSFEFHGKRGNRKAVAIADRQIAELQLARLRALLKAEVKKRYYENLLANENLANQQFAVQLLDDLQGLLTERYQSGAASYVDVVRARIELGRGRSDLAAVQQEQLAALTRLNLLLGRQSTQLLLLSDSLTFVPLTLPRDSTLLLRQSYLRQIFVVTVERQRRALRLAQLAGRPDFSFGASFQRVAENPPFTAAQPEGQTVNAFGLEASISLPLFNRAAPKGELQIAQAELAAAETRLAYFEQRMRHNFEVAFAAVETAEKQVLEFRHVVLPESQNAVNAAAAAYQSGQLSLTDLLDVYRTARQARLEKSRVIFNYLSARADLEAVGEKFDQAE